MKSAYIQTIGISKYRWSIAFVFFFNFSTWFSISEICNIANAQASLRSYSNKRKNDRIFCLFIILGSNFLRAVHNSFIKSRNMYLYQSMSMCGTHASRLTLTRRFSLMRIICCFVTVPWSTSSVSTRSFEKRKKKESYKDNNRKLLCWNDLTSCVFTFSKFSNTGVPKLYT